jgi:hypothetical protein
LLDQNEVLPISEYIKFTKVRDILDYEYFLSPEQINLLKNNILEISKRV